MGDLPIHRSAKKLFSLQREGYTSRAMEASNELEINLISLLLVRF